MVVLGPFVGSLAEPIKEMLLSTVTCDVVKSKDMPISFPNKKSAFKALLKSAQTQE
jgi:hypothetical protein